MITEKVKVSSLLLSQDDGARINGLELKIKTLESASEAVRAAASLRAPPRLSRATSDHNDDRKPAAVARSKQAAVWLYPSLASEDADDPSLVSLLSGEGGDGYEVALQSSLEVGDIQNPHYPLDGSQCAS